MKTLKLAKITGGRFYALISAIVAFSAAFGAFAEDAYVGSEGANIIYTDYYANPNTRIELDFKYTTGGGMIVSPWVKGAGLATALWNAGGESGLQFLVGDAVSGSGKAVKSGHTLSTDRRFLSIDCHTGKLQIAVHGAAVTNEVDSGASFTQNAVYPVCLLGSTKSTDASSIEPTHLSKARIYGCKIYEWNETSGEYDLKRNYVPVLRDGQPCLRDSVTGAFALDPRKDAAALNYGGDIEEVGHGYIQSLAAVGLNTGYKMNATSRVELDCALASASGVVRPMGCWNNASTMRYLAWTSSSKVQFFLNSGSSSGQGPAIDTDRHVWVFDAAGNKGCYLTGSTVVYSRSGTAPSSGEKSTNPLGIFADTSNSSGTAWSQPATGMKCYGLKIYESGNLVTNFVPYVRNGEAGFRDTITGAFLSAGTSSFAAGGNIELSGPTAKDAFVESDGTQVLNSGYNVTRNSRIEVDFAFTKGNRGFLFGNYASGGSLRWCGWLDSGPLNFACAGNNGTTANTIIMNPGPGQTRIKAVYDMKNGQGWVVTDGVAGGKVTLANASSLAENEKCTFPMGIFGSLKSADGTVVDTTVPSGVMRVYSVRIYENDALTAEFLPYKGTEGVGLYDTKTRKLALKHSASVADPAIGGMGVDGAEKWLAEPADTALTSTKTVTLTAKAAGAISYKWTCNGEAVSGGTDGALEVAWRHAKTPDVYAVTPVYTVFGREVEGEAKLCEVTNVPEGLLLIVR